MTALELTPEGQLRVMPLSVIQELIHERNTLREERDEAREQNEEQCKLLAMSADREEKLRTDLMLARKLADSAMLESDRLRARLHKEQA